MAVVAVMVAVVVIIVSALLSENRGQRLWSFWLSWIVGVRRRQLLRT
jgi:hypothetical protein